GDGGGDLGVDLVGRDLEQRLVDVDGVADLLQPAGDGALGDGLAERGQGDGRAAGRTAARAGLRGGGLLRLTGGRPLVGRGGVLPAGSACPGPDAAVALRPRDVSDVYALCADLGDLDPVPTRRSADLGDGGGDLGVDLVGRDLEQRLVDVDGVADALEPAGDGALGDGFTECRHLHGFSHGFSPPGKTGSGGGVQRLAGERECRFGQGLRLRAGAVDEGG